MDAVSICDSSLLNNEQSLRQEQTELQEIDTRTMHG